MICGPIDEPISILNGHEQGLAVHADRLPNRHLGHPSNGVVGSTFRASEYFHGCNMRPIRRGRQGAIGAMRATRMRCVAIKSGEAHARRPTISNTQRANLRTITVIDYKEYRIEVTPVGMGWRASIFSPGSTSPWPNSPLNLEKSSTEEIVAEAKRIIEVRLGPRLL